MTWLFAEEANDRAVTAKWDVVWTGARVIVILHFMVIPTASALDHALREFTLTREMRE